MGALPPLETPTRKGGTLPLHGAHTAFSCYPALRLYRLSKSQRGIGVVSLSKRYPQVPIGNLTVQVAVVYGTANARAFLQRMQESGKQYHFVEVMACPGGCIGGGGQPKDLTRNVDKTRQRRIAALYQRDSAMTLRTSHENPEIKAVYEAFYGQPLSPLAEQMLHTTYQNQSARIQKKGGESVKKWVCGICGYVYDEAKEGVAFDALPDDWVCPLCGADKSAFSPQQPTSEPKAPPAPIHHVGDMRQLSAGELSAVCSNLARGCEKQYKEQEAALFREIADFLSAAQPPEADPSLDKLLERIRQDLNQGYPALNAAAKAAGDRGTQRICVWGEKVTRMLESLLNRYQKDGEAFLKNTQVWVCTVCGFIYVGDSAPQLCPVCKVPAWKFEQVEGRD